MKFPRTSFLAALAALLLPLAVVRADDLTTLSGTTYRQAVAVHVEPDGVTWQHATGVAKVPFDDLPDSVRQTYHYDAATAAAYRAAQQQARAAADAQNQQVLQAAEARRKAHFQQVVASGFASATGNTFSLRRETLTQNDFAESLLGEQIAALKDKQAPILDKPGGVANELLWKALPGLRQGTGAADVAVQNYRASSQHPIREGTTHAWDDGAYQPNYSVRDYYKETDRSEALLRNAGW